MRSLALIFRIELAVAGTLNGRYKSECDTRLVDDKSAYHSTMLKNDFKDGFQELCDWRWAKLWGNTELRTRFAWTS